MPAHSALTGADLHEPKGVAAASANTAYIADGAGSGAWAKIDSDNIDTTSIKNINRFRITVQFLDVSTAETILVPLSEAGTITRITAVINGPITGADTTITFTNNGSSSLGTMTIAQAGSAEGDFYTLTPASNNVFTANTYLKCVCDGASTGSGQHLTLVIEYTVS